MKRLHMRRTQGDDGSMMLALVAAFGVTALVAVALASAATSQQSSTRDRAFTNAVQVADAGVQQASFLANSGTLRSQWFPTPWTCTGDGPTGRTSPVQRVDLNGVPTAYQVAESCENGVTEYVVRSSGHEAGSTRTVTARLGQTPRFPLAAFADSSVEFRGNNRASSYDSRTGAQNTGNGRVGSNGTMTFRGSADADGTDGYDYENNPDNRCSGSPCGDEDFEPHDDPLDIGSGSATSFVQQAIDTCNADPTRVPQAWVASQHGGVLAPSPAGFHCFSSMTFDVSTTLQTSDPLKNPVVVYVTGLVSVSRNRSVNYTGSAPVSRGLQIYSLGDRVAIGNHAKISAAIWAPNADCQGNPSNAQAEIYGSLVCRAINNQGGWTFHYDDALGGLSDGTYRLRNYAEQPGATPVPLP